MESVIAVRYATSLFEVGMEENCLEAMHQELAVIQAAFCENPEYPALLASPMLTKEEKRQMLKASVGSGVGEYLLNFLMLLVDKNRFGQFEAIVVEFTRLYNQKHNIRTAVAVTAVPMNEELQAKLKAKLEATTGSTILLENQVDPTILGGVVLQMENSQMDASVHSRIEAIKRQIGTVIA